MACELAIMQTWGKHLDSPSNCLVFSDDGFKSKVNIKHWMGRGNIIW